MKVIITKTFKKNFLNNFDKYFSVLDFVQKIKKDKIKITLKIPFYKLKFKLNLVDFRGVLLIIKNDKIIPIMLYLKKDKKNGENIIWNKYENKILAIQEKVSKDLENGNYEIF